jgi:hypothetical protein
MKANSKIVIRLRKFVLCTIVLLFVFQAKSQNPINNSDTAFSKLDLMMVTQRVNCYNVYESCSFLIPRYYYQGKKDSLIVLANYWQNRCGANSRNVVLQLLNKIYLNKFTSDSISYNTVEWLEEYIAGRIFYNPAYANQYGYSDYINTYNDFIYDYANELKRNCVNPEAKLICSVLADSSANILKKYLKKYKPITKIHFAYSKYQDSLYTLPAMIMGVQTGYTKFLGANQLLGDKFVFGFHIGRTSNKNTFLFNIDIRSGKSINEYYVWKDDSLTKTQHYSGFYAGLEYQRSIYQKKSSALKLCVGGGIENLTAIAENTSKDISPFSIRSYNFNGGLIYNFRINPSSSMFIQATYNLLDFKNNKGTNLSGNAMCIKIGWSITAIDYTKNNLRYR